MGKGLSLYLSDKADRALDAIQRKRKKYGKGIWTKSAITNEALLAFYREENGYPKCECLDTGGDCKECKPTYARCRCQVLEEYPCPMCGAKEAADAPCD